jgi:hypothetical protein
MAFLGCACRTRNGSPTFSNNHELSSECIFNFDKGLLTALGISRPTNSMTSASDLMTTLIALGLLLLGSASIGQNTPAAHLALLREVKGQTLISQELPKADLIFRKEFRYIGSQQINLYGNAEAEQYLFVKAGTDGIVERFYWVQFEHFLPTNKRTYDYSPDRTTEIGGLRFIYDVKSWPDYAAQAEDPASDGAAIERLLGMHGLSFPKEAVRVRMFHLPSPDHRTELMIPMAKLCPHTREFQSEEVESNWTGSHLPWHRCSLSTQGKT